MKIEITKKQAENYNRMLYALRVIGKDYQTSDQLRRDSEKDYGLDFEDAIEMAYDNIQMTAKNGSKGISPLKIEEA